MLGVRWNPLVASLVLTIIATISLTLSYAVISSAAEKDYAWGLVPLLLVLIGGWIAFEWQLASKPRKKRGLAVLLEFKPVARLGLIAIAAPLTAGQALPFFEPGPATRDDVKSAVNEGLTEREEAKQSALLKEFSGLWGEPGCMVAYRFKLVGASVIEIDWERRPQGEPAWKASGTILKVEDDRISTRGETPAAEKGKAATFWIRTDGPVEKLIWKDESTDVAAELERCT